MEQLNEFDEEPPIENDLVMIDEDGADGQRKRAREWPEDESEIRIGAQDGRAQRPVQQARDEIADLQQQLRQARQAMLDFRMMINELENRERCETRKFDGIIQNPNERFMPCAFCGRRGDHYSDSCLVYRFTGERKERVNRAHLCTMCLDYDCPGGRRCLKRNTRCYHCGRSGHNSALCTLPEKSVCINDELELLQRRYYDAFIRVYRLERKLRRRGVDLCAKGVGVREDCLN
ncbi:hypothetical protein OSTOST_06705 [Ostertagia ostertagi]